MGWLNLFAAGSGLTGLALVLAAASFAWYRFRVHHLRPGEAGRLFTGSRAARYGLVLFCISRLPGNSNWLEILLCTLLALHTGYSLFKSGLFPGKPAALAANSLPGQSAAGPVLTPEAPGQDPVSPAAKSPAVRLFYAAGRFIERTRPLWVGAALASFTLGGSRFLVPGLLVLALLWAWAGITCKTWGRFTPVDLSLGLWLLLVPVTLYVTSNPGLTGNFLAYFLAQLIAFYSVVTWARNTRRLQLVGWGLVLAGTLLAAATPLLIRQGNRFFSLNSLFGPDGLLRVVEINRNVLAGSLAVMLPFCCGFLLSQSPGRFYKLRLSASGLALVVVGAGLALTQSRGAYAAAAVGLLLVLAMQWPRIGLIVSGLGGAGLLVLLAGLFSSPSMVNRFLPGGLLDGLDDRLEVWSRAVYAIQDFPFTGIGMGTFGPVTTSLYPYFRISSENVIPHAHNIFLQAGVDLGLPGLTGFLALLFSLLAAGFLGWQRWKAANNRAASRITLGGLGSLCAMLLHGGLDAVTWGTRPAFLSWAILGLLLASYLVSEE
jgi:putative inorganic carbon (HCO3(-)) transporter